LEDRILPRDICSHASSTSGPLPTYGDASMMGVRLYRTELYLTIGAAGAGHGQSLASRLATPPGCCSQ
jgi:hypothetical protein